MTESSEDGNVVRFRSGTRYNYVAISRGDVWQTTGRHDARTTETPINEFAFNPINKLESWDDLIARANTFALALEWEPAPAVLKNELAVVRFILEDPPAWHAAVHAGSGRWYSTVAGEAHSVGDESGLRIYDYPRIESWGDIVDCSSRVDIATKWQPLDGFGLPTYR